MPSNEFESKLIKSSNNVDEFIQVLKQYKDYDYTHQQLSETIPDLIPQLSNKKTIIPSLAAMYIPEERNLHVIDQIASNYFSYEIVDSLTYYLKGRKDVIDSLEYFSDFVFEDDRFEYVMNKSKRIHYKFRRQIELQRKQINDYIAQAFKKHFEFDIDVTKIINELTYEADSNFYYDDYIDSSNFFVDLSNIFGYDQELIESYFNILIMNQQLPSETSLNHLDLDSDFKYKLQNHYQYYPNTRHQHKHIVLPMTQSQLVFDDSELFLYFTNLYFMKRLDDCIKIIEDESNYDSFTSYVHIVSNYFQNIGTSTYVLNNLHMLFLYEIFKDHIILSKYAPLDRYVKALEDLRSIFTPTIANKLAILINDIAKDVPQEALDKNVDTLLSFTSSDPIKFQQLLQNVDETYYKRMIDHIGLERNKSKYCDDARDQVSDPTLILLFTFLIGSNRKLKNKDKKYISKYVKENEVETFIEFLSTKPQYVETQYGNDSTLYGIHSILKDESKKK